jgi:uncharacterized phage protein (TIGR02218 family)
VRSIPVALQAHLDRPDTTTTRLLRILLKDGTSFGITTLDRDVTYDDGDGEVTYAASNGFDASRISSDVGYTVDNAEGYALISDDVPGTTIEMVDAGALDDAQWILYIVNYEDLSMGHMLLDAGDLGQVRTKYGMVWIPELLSYAARLRQPIGLVDSRTCRAIFGSPADSQTGCGVDAEALWVEGEVLSVGAETSRTFTGDVTTTSPVDPFPGRVEWLTGNNEGAFLSTESFAAGVVTLDETTPYPIEVGDTYRIRPDCRKRYLEDCIGTWANGPNFKGEPLLPGGDAAQLQTPGAQMPGGGGYLGRIVELTEES